MGVRGSSGWVAVGKQSAKGTPATKFHYLRFTEYGVEIVPSFTQLIEGGGDGKIIGSPISAIDIDGDITLNANSPNLARFLAWVSGQDIVGADSTTHDITWSPDVPWITIKRNVDDDFVEQINDCKVSQLVINIENGGLVTMAATMMGTGVVHSAASETEDDYRDAGSYEAKTLNFADATVELDSVITTNWTAISLTFNRNMEGQHQGHDPKRATIHEGNFMLEGTLSLKYEDATLYKKFLTGSGTGTNLNEEQGYEGSLKITFDDDQNKGRIRIPVTIFTGKQVPQTAENAPIESELAFWAQENKNKTDPIFEVRFILDKPGIDEDLA